MKVSQTYFRAIENDDITLFCEIRTSSSLPSNAYNVTWSKNGNTIDRSQSRYINGNVNIPSLTITSVVTSDTGVYSCSASTTGSVSQNGYTITLFVQEAGKWVLMNQSLDCLYVHFFRILLRFILELFLMRCLYFCPAYTCYLSSSLYLIIYPR